LECPECKLAEAYAVTWEDDDRKPCALVRPAMVEDAVILRAIHSTTLMSKGLVGLGGVWITPTENAAWWPGPSATITVDSQGRMMSIDVHHGWVIVCCFAVITCCPCW
jgi:hypothetical protein